MSQWRELLLLLSPHVLLELPRSLPLFESLSMPLDPMLPLLRLLGSFSESSDCPIFLPKSTEESLLL
jgi:hypothetical protein